VIFLLCVMSQSLVMGQSQKMFSLPSGSKMSDYESGQVWVKLKREHKYHFEGQSSGRTASGINAVNIKPLLSRQSREKGSARMSPRKPQVDISLYFRIEFDKNRPVEDFIRELYTTGYFETVEPVPSVRPFFAPNDPSINLQYHLNLIHAPEAWNITQGSQSIVIAIIDTGGDLDHPDLQANLYIDPAEPVDGVDNDNDGYIDNNRGWDFSGDDIALIGTPGFTGDNDPSVTKGGLTAHGTMVAGCASASTNNGVGISSVGFNTRLMFTKHYADNQTGSSYSSNLYEGVLYAATHGANIINCSWGGYNPNTIAQDIITHVTVDLGCLVVAAAGNSNLENPIYPASYEHVLSVASCDQNDVRSHFSNFGKTIDILSPGSVIYTTTYNDAYATDSGTSLAAPIVSGAAALVWANNPAFTSLQVAEQLRVSADESIYVKNPAFVNKLGKGRLDVLSALTITSPSIRASNQLLTNVDGTSPDLGESVRLYLDFTNYLQPSTGDLKATLSSSSPYITITKNEINLGIIPENSTVRNSANPFEIILSTNLPIDHTIEAVLTFSDGDYQDFQLLNFVIPSYIDVKENNIITSITSGGRIGYGNAAEQKNGSGFIYDEESILFEMGLIMGSSATTISNNVRSINATYDQDFTPADKITKLTPGERSYSEIVGSFRNAPEISTASLAISYRSLVWNDVPFRDFVILEYKVKNTSASVIPDFHFGVFADWDIALGGANDRASWDSDTRLGYVFPGMPLNLPQAGIQALNANAHYYAIENDQTIPGNPFGIYDGFTDNEKFLTISSGLSKIQAGAANGNDVSHVVATGPYTIDPGQEVTLAFALHASKSTIGLITSAKYADTLYNYTLKAPLPTVDPEIAICYGSSVTIEASGATNFKWYKDFTGGSPIFSGAQFQTGNLYSDTVFYVSNADETYESVRRQTNITVKPNPLATFTVSPETSHSGEMLTFSAAGTDGASWFWDFGDGITSAVQNPVHSYEHGGEYEVTLTVTSSEGCKATSKKTLGVITGVENLSNGKLEIYPNPVTIDRLQLVVSETLSDGELKLFTSHGVLIRKESLKQGQQSIDVSTLPNGIYIIKIGDSSNLTTRKVVISR